MALSHWRTVTKNDTHRHRPRIASMMLAIYWLTLVTATHWPLKIPPPGQPILGKDKVLHFSAYAGLAFLFGLVATLRRRQAPTAALALVAALCAVLAGLADEVTQPLTGRDFEWWDWLADSLGAAAGSVFLFLAAWLLSASALGIYGASRSESGN